MIVGEAEEDWDDWHNGESWKDLGGAKFSCAGADHLISGQPKAVASGKGDLWTRPVQIHQLGALELLLKPLNPPIESFTNPN